MDLASLAAPQDASTPEERAQALRAALLGQQQMSVLNQATGNPYLAKMGQAQQANAGEQQSQLATAEQSRLERALRAQQIAQEGRYQQGELANSAQRNRQEAQYQQGELANRKEQLDQGRFTHSPQHELGIDVVLDNKTGETKVVPLGGANGVNRFTRVPEPEMKTASALLGAIDSANKAEEARKSGVLPGFGEYDAVLKAEAPGMAAGDSLTGRPTGTNDIIKRAPNLYSGEGSYFPAIRDRAVNALRLRVNELKAQGYNTSEIETELASRVGQQQANGAGSIARAPTHYSYSADRKQRIPTDESGNPVGPVEQVP